MNVLEGMFRHAVLVVEGKSEEELEQKMHSIAEGFFEVFPERKQEVFNKVVTIPAKF